MVSRVVFRFRTWAMDKRGSGHFPLPMESTAHWRHGSMSGIIMQRRYIPSTAEDVRRKSGIGSVQGEGGKGEGRGERGEGRDGGDEEEAFLRGRTR
jgi:hypothetical protein